MLRWGYASAGPLYLDRYLRYLTLPCFCGVAVHIPKLLNSYPVARMIAPPQNRACLALRHPLFHHPSSIPRYSHFSLHLAVENRTSDYHGTPWRTSRSLYTDLVSRFHRMPVSAPTIEPKQHSGVHPILQVKRQSSRAPLDTRCASALQPSRAVGFHAHRQRYINTAIATDNCSPGSSG